MILNEFLAWDYTMQPKKRPDNLSMNSRNTNTCYIFPIITDKPINSGQVHLEKNAKRIFQRYGWEMFRTYEYSCTSEPSPHYDRRLNDSIHLGKAGQKWYNMVSV